MSVRSFLAPPGRLNQDQLFAPATWPELFAKLASSAAAVINLDLEDAVTSGDPTLGAGSRRSWRTAVPWRSTAA